MELKYLQTLKVILETGSFVGAAKKLNYTQSTITFQMQQLEQELNMKLFEKIGRKMCLTQKGKDILPFADKVLEAVIQLENCGKAIENLQGDLKISLPETLLTYQMQPVLKAFREQAPKVRLSLEALNCYKIREQITTGSTDIGVHYDVGGYSNSILIDDLAAYTFCLVASPDMETSEMDFSSARQQKSCCLLLNDSASVYFRMFDTYLKKMDIVTGGTLILGSVEATKRSAMSNLGVAFLPRFVVSKELQEGRLIELDTGLKEETVKSVYAYHKNKWITPSMHLFISLLKEYLPLGI